MARDTASHRSEARERLGAQDRQRRHAAAADALMPLAIHYEKRSGLPKLPAGTATCPAGCSWCWSWGWVA
jgi:hypothetical protein